MVATGGAAGDEDLPAGGEGWQSGLLYVIGHQRPDTDAIASALGYAWLLRETGTAEACAARAGQPNPQAAHALRRCGEAAPVLLTSVYPTFGHVARPHPTLPPEAPLRAAAALFAAGERTAPVVDARGAPLGVVTAVALARALADPDLARALGAPCAGAMVPAPLFPARERVSDHRRALLRLDDDDFLVLDDAGRCTGVATRAHVLEPPRARLVLVDHNELEQAVAGAEEAEITAVLDHHRLGNPPTPAPIPFAVEPVGSCSTLVAERCGAAGLAPPPGIAGMLLSGVLSDTLLFHSPTTTDRDRAAAAWLASLAGLDVESWGAELLRAGPALAGRDPGEVLDTDRKSYPMGGRRVGVAQVEVTGLQDLPEARAGLLAALEQRRAAEDLALLALMVTDVVTGRSRLLARGDRRLLAALPFPRAGEGEWDLGDIVSRKKQLVPTLQGVLEAAG